MNDPVELVQNQLLVTLAQAVLVMHQTGYMPGRLREQLTRQIGELEALTERYAEVDHTAAVYYGLAPRKPATPPRAGSASLKLVPDGPTDPAA